MVINMKKKKVKKQARMIENFKKKQLRENCISYDIRGGTEEGRAKLKASLHDAARLEWVKVVNESVLLVYSPTASGKGAMNLYKSKAGAYIMNNINISHLPEFMEIPEFVAKQYIEGFKKHQETILAV